MEALAKLILGRSALKIWVFIVEITDEFILGLDVLQAWNASVDLGRHVLRPGREGATLWSPGARPQISRFILAAKSIECTCYNGACQRSRSGASWRHHPGQL
jgi:hypothetical protein